MERDVQRFCNWYKLSDFNSHAHVERDTAYKRKNIFSVYFNSHAHVERDNVVNLLTMYNTISTHTLTWSVTANIGIIFINMMHFNSHAHVERDCINSDDWKRQCISTHTLTWSVTGRK